MQGGPAQTPCCYIQAAVQMPDVNYSVSCGLAEMSISAESVRVCPSVTHLATIAAA